MITTCGDSTRSRGCERIIHAWGAWPRSWNSVVRVALRTSLETVRLSKFAAFESSVCSPLPMAIRAGIPVRSSADSRSRSSAW
eukprot:1800101-Prymnesium_polylepis.1